MTQAELAEQLGVVSEAVGQWERAGRRMELDRLPRIATALKIDVKPLCLLALSEFHPSFHAALCDGNEKEFHS